MYVQTESPLLTGLLGLAELGPLVATGGLLIAAAGVEGAYAVDALTCLAMVGSVTALARYDRDKALADL